MYIVNRKNKLQTYVMQNKLFDLLEQKLGEEYMENHLKCVESDREFKMATTFYFKENEACLKSVTFYDFNIEMEYDGKDNRVSHYDDAKYFDLLQKQLNVEYPKFMEKIFGSEYVNDYMKYRILRSELKEKLNNHKANVKLNVDVEHEQKVVEKLENKLQALKENDVNSPLYEKNQGVEKQKQIEKTLEKELR